MSGPTETRGNMNEEQRIRCENEIAAVLMRTFGYVRLDVRYKAAQEALRYVAEHDPGALDRGYEFVTGAAAPVGSPAGPAGEA